MGKEIKGKESGKGEQDERESMYSGTGVFRNTYRAGFRWPSTLHSTL